MWSLDYHHVVPLFMTGLASPPSSIHASLLSLSAYPFQDAFGCLVYTLRRQVPPPRVQFQACKLGGGGGAGHRGQGDAASGFPQTGLGKRYASKTLQSVPIQFPPFFSLSLLVCV